MPAFKVASSLPGKIDMATKPKPKTNPKTTTKNTAKMQKRKEIWGTKFTNSQSKGVEQG